RFPRQEPQARAAICLPWSFAEAHAFRNEHVIEGIEKVSIAALQRLDQARVEFSRLAVHLRLGPGRRALAFSGLCVGAGLLKLRKPERFHARKLDSLGPLGEQFPLAFRRRDTLRL